MSLLKKKYILIPVGTLLLALGLTGCDSGEDTDAPELVQQVTVNDNNLLLAEQISKVTYGDVLNRDLYDGVVSPYVEELYFAEDGSFLEYAVAIGDTVEKGQVIARVDNGDVEDRIESLEEQIANLTNQYEYQLATLKNKEAIIIEEMNINYLYLSGNDSGSARFTELCRELGRQDKNLKSNQLEQKHLTEEYELELPYLQEQLKELKAQLNSNIIKAPFDGTVVQLRTVATGDYVDAENPYAAVADTSRYIVVGEYVDSSLIKHADSMYVFINGKEYEAAYLPIDKEVYSKIIARGGKVYSSYEIQPDGSFDFGQSALIDIVWDTRKDVLTVPNIAVQREGSKFYCYVKRGDEKEKVYIETGLNDGMNYEVESGLVEGDEVFID